MESLKVGDVMLTVNAVLTRGKIFCVVSEFSGALSCS